MSVIIKAPAKINIFLEILSARPDGFAEIRSLIQAVSLYDIIRVERAESGLTLACSDSDVPLDSSNTVAKAWALLCGVLGNEFGAIIDIRKNIPLESGLGGGSSDAAAALVGMCREWGVDLSRRSLAQIGAAIGSDVPFFFGSGSSVVEGRGEIVLDVPAKLDYAILLVKPPYGMNTGDAYSIARKALTNNDLTNSFKRLDYSAEITRLAGRGNALENSLFKIHPEAMEIKKRLIEAGARFAAMSGSGSSFFGIFDSISGAYKARSAFDDMWNAAVEPVGITFFE